MPAPDGGRLAAARGGHRPSPLGHPSSRPVHRDRAGSGRDWAGRQPAETGRERRRLLVGETRRGRLHDGVRPLLGAPLVHDLDEDLLRPANDGRSFHLRTFALFGRHVEGACPPRHPGFARRAFRHARLLRPERPLHRFPIIEEARTRREGTYTCSARSRAPRSSEPFTARSARPYTHRPAASRPPSARRRPPRRALPQAISRPCAYPTSPGPERGDGRSGRPRPPRTRSGAGRSLRA